MWANDSAGLPSGKLTVPAPKLWDYCFRDLRAEPIVRWPGELELTIGSDCEDWVIYDIEDAGVCVEPWTAPPNSLNMLNPHIVTPDVPHRSACARGHASSGRVASLVCPTPGANARFCCTRTRRGATTYVGQRFCRPA